MGVVVMVRRHVRKWLVCGLVATMPALCLGQETSASSTSESSSGAAEGFNPFGAVKNFFDRVLPAQRAPSAPAPTPLPAQDTSAVPAAPPAVLSAVPLDVSPARANASASTPSEVTAPAAAPVAPVLAPAAAVAPVLTTPAGRALC